jgi:subtilisin family serine protease
VTARPAFLRVVLAAGEARAHVPCHLDCLLGAARPAGGLDRGGRLDRSLGGSGRFRVRGVFHARASLGRVGQQATRWADDEESLGMSRSFLVELGEDAMVTPAIERLRSLSVVQSVSSELLSHGVRAASSQQFGLPTHEEAEAPFAAVHAREALEQEPGSPSVTVAVVDTGVSATHPELAGRLLTGYDTVDLGIGPLAVGLELIGDISGPDIAPDDEVGHGTHVTGVIAAAGRRLPRGLSGDCVALPVRVLAGAVSSAGGRPFGVGSLTDIDLGVKLAADRRARVVNLSLGTPATEVDPDGPVPHADVCAYAERRGLVLVAAAGNDGTAVPYFPAVLPTVLAVGSVGSDGHRSSFSNTGAHVKIHAPGDDIVGLGLQGYRRSSGTSHAAPFVSSAAALLVAHAERLGQPLDPQTVRDLLIRTATARVDRGPAVLDAAGALSALSSTRHSVTEPGALT